VAKVSVYIITNSNKSLKVKVPSVRIVCPECNGDGTELKPGLKGEAFTRQDIESMGEDFHDMMSNMMAGHYDCACSRCDGKNVVDEPDLKLLEEKYPYTLQAYWKQKDQESADYWESYYEMRAGC